MEVSLGTSLQQPYFSVTFHPVTLENDREGNQISELLDAIGEFPMYKLIFTKANSDAGNRIVNEKVDRFVSTHNNCEVYDSLGLNRYLSLIRYSCGVIGNSSGGIVEAPILSIPSVNIGDRQKGRLRAKSIIDCTPNKNSIFDAIKLFFKK